MKQVNRREMLQLMSLAALPTTSVGGAVANTDSETVGETQTQTQPRITEGFHDLDNEVAAVTTASADSDPLMTINSTTPTDPVSSREHLMIDYESGYRSDAEQVAEWYEDAEDFGEERIPSSVEVQVPTEIIIYPASEWDRSDGVLYWRGTFPRQVHLQAPSDSPNGEEWHRTGLGSELFNIVQTTHKEESDAGYRYYDRNPSWFHEGLSWYLTKEQPTVDNPTSAMKYEKSQIRDGLFHFSVVSENAYRGGALICESLLATEDVDMKAMFDLIINDTAMWSEAVADEFGMTPFGIHAMWLKWVDEELFGDDIDDVADPSVEVAAAMQRGVVEPKHLVAAFKARDESWR